MFLIYNISLLFGELLYIFDAESLLKNGGLLLAFIIVYGTTGLFFCFFIPSSAFLFAAGILTATGTLGHNIVTVCIILVLASITGNITGYWFGRKTGPLLYKRKDSRFFHQEHLKTAKTFYEKYGALALSVGMYLPIVRTFAPIVAGMIQLNFRRFLLLIVGGSLIWVLSFVLVGYLLGTVPLLKPWANYIIIGFIIVVTIPLIFRVIGQIKKIRKENESRIG